MKVVFATIIIIVKKYRVGLLEQAVRFHHDVNLYLYLLNQCELLDPRPVGGSTKRYVE